MNKFLPSLPVAVPGRKSTLSTGWPSSVQFPSSAPAANPTHATLSAMPLATSPIAGSQVAGSPFARPQPFAPAKQTAAAPFAPASTHPASDTPTLRSRLVGGNIPVRPAAWRKATEDVSPGLRAMTSHLDTLVQHFVTTTAYRIGRRNHAAAIPAARENTKRLVRMCTFDC